MAPDVNASRPPKSRGRKLRERIPYVILIVVMGLFAYKFIEKDQQTHRLQTQANALQVSNQRTAETNDRIQRSLQYYRTRDYVEEQARAHLNYTYPGETLVQSDPIPQRIVQVRPAPPRLPALSRPTWQQWWDAFFG